MGRFHGKTIAGVHTLVPFTQAEEDAQDAAEAEAAILAQAAAAERARCDELDAAIAADATIAQLKAMTNDEFDAWWTGNVTNLAQANAVLKRLARVAVRRLF